MTTVLKLALATALLGGGGYGGYRWYAAHHAAPKFSFKTAEATRGQLIARIAATGTLEPLETVDVGAQVAGIIDKFGADPRDPSKLIDYNSEVDEGTLLAHIDDTMIRADRDAAQATVAQAQATLAKAEADLIQKRALFDQAKQQWERAEAIGPSDALSKSDYDTYHANYEVAQANVTIDEANIKESQGALKVAEAALNKAQRNLDYCTIVSPVKGTILDRRVNVGQTVVSSLSAPSLFLIAKDLNHLVAWASVNEADIGRIHAGQPATFTVDAYPDETFHGTVNKVRYTATVTQNVVTYTIEVDVDNSARKLRPYQTTNLQFEVNKQTDVLKAPNAALRWMPSEDEVAPAYREQFAAMNEHGGMFGPDHHKAAPATSQPAQWGHRATVWIEEGGFVKPVSVRTGMTDNNETEIRSPDIVEGTRLVTGENQNAGDEDSVNPFMPNFKRH